MAITKAELENLIYLKRRMGSRRHLLNVPQPTTEEKTEVNNVVDELMGYILTKHS